MMYTYNVMYIHSTVVTTITNETDLLHFHMKRSPLVLPSLFLPLALQPGHMCYVNKPSEATSVDFFSPVLACFLLAQTATFTCMWIHVNYRQLDLRHAYTLSLLLRVAGSGFTRSSSAKRSSESIMSCETNRQNQVS